MGALTLDLLCGGPSPEHAVSLVSASAIIRGLLQARQEFRLHPVWISREGVWHRSREAVGEPWTPENLSNLEKNGQVVVPGLHPQGERYFACLEGEPSLPLPDVFFPVLHGSFGEDGTLQGMLQALGKPYVGCGVLAGGTGMDKIVFRKLVEAEGIPVLPWLWLTRESWLSGADAVCRRVETSLVFPVFVKPSRLGSSIGISKVAAASGLGSAIENALQHDRRVLVETGRPVRELECALLGNAEPRVSVIGEIIPGAEFYDYEDKYHSGKTRLVIPADLPVDLAQRIQDDARRAFNLMDGAGLARADFFLDRETGSVFMNEINTFPGFTENSMYPKLWGASGLEFPDLLVELIRLAVQKMK